MSVYIMSHQIKLGDRVKLILPVNNPVTNAGIHYGLLQEIQDGPGLIVELLTIDGSRSRFFAGDLFPCEDEEYNTQRTLNFIKETAGYE